MSRGRILVVDDDESLRRVMQVQLEDLGYDVATAADGDSALRSLQLSVRELVISDLKMPGMSGIDGLKLLREKYPRMALLMLSVYEDDERIFEALCAGASGYLLKKTPPNKLLEYLAEVLRGGAPMSPEVARRVVRLFREIRPPERVEYDLTPHELRLLRLLVEGHNYQSAAAELGVSFSTINFHMQNIYGKLQVHSKSEAVAKALRQRLVK